MEDQAALDQAAIRSVLQGNREAFAGLVTRYQRMVAGIAWRHGFRPEDVEDIVSEVFIKAYRNLDRYRPHHPFATWLYRLAANHVVDRTRRERRERGRVEMPAQIADPDAAPRRDLERRERTELVREALAEVPRRFREAIRLVYVEGMKIEEAARALGAPEGTVKTRLMRGRKALKRVLLERHPGYFEDDHAV